MRCRFGAERNHKSGPDSATTVVGENVRLKLQPGGIKNQEEDDDKDNAMRQKLLTKKINCRLCQGEHFTTRCPYKDTLNGVMGEGGESRHGAQVTAVDWVNADLLDALDRFRRYFRTDQRSQRSHAFRSSGGGW